MKAADISDTRMLRAIEIDREERDMWAACTGTIADGQFPTLPHKVVAAKLRQLLKRGLVSGCACGCRGDWQVTEAGALILGEDDE